jgi:hypothetical protein
MATGDMTACSNPERVDWATGLVAQGGLIFGCGLPGWAIVRRVFNFIERNRDAGIDQVAKDVLGWKREISSRVLGWPLSGWIKASSRKRFGRYPQHAVRRGAQAPGHVAAVRRSIRVTTATAGRAIRLVRAAVRRAEFQFEVIGKGNLRAGSFSRSARTRG